MLRLLARVPLWVWLLLVLGALTAWELAPEPVAPLNPDALETVASIVALCERADATDSVAAGPCDDVRYFARWCRTRGRGMCSLNKFYDSMVALGFHLPPLYTERP